MTNIKNNQNIIIEGIYLPLEHIKDFEPEYIKQMIILDIGFLENYSEKNSISGIVEHRSEIERKTAIKCREV